VTVDLGASTAVLKVQDGDVLANLFCWHHGRTQHH